MSGVLFDTNVLLDIATADPVWLSWSEGQLRTAAAQEPILINPIIYAELASAFATEADLDRWLDVRVFHRLPLPYSAGWSAAQAFVKYRRSGGVRTRRCPTFTSAPTLRSRTERSSHVRHRVQNLLFNGGPDHTAMSVSGSKD